VEQCRKDIIEAVQRVDTGEGVAILTDMFGGTPSNLAISVMSRPKVEGPGRDQSADAGQARQKFVTNVRSRRPSMRPQEAGRKYVTIASRVLNGK